MSLMSSFLSLFDLYHLPNFPVRNKVLALTFDDGPDPTFTPLILDVLAQFNAKATFFLVGQQVQKHPELARRIIKEGHEIGNHTWSHPLLLFKSQRGIAYEIEKTQTLITEVTGCTPLWFRPPFGVYGVSMKSLLLVKNLRPILWTKSLGDWRPKRVSRLKKIMSQGLKPGAVFLLHDGAQDANYTSRHQTVELLKEQLPLISQLNYQCVTLTELVS